MEYKIIERLSKNDYEKLELLIAKCNGYTPFYLANDDSPDELCDYDSDEETSDFEDYVPDDDTSDFEDYDSDELSQLAAYDDNGNMAGFISFIYDKDFNCCAVSGDKENYYKDLSHGMPKDLPELTALVAPEYRHQQIFSEMFERIKAATGINDFIVSGSLQKEPAFLEYLMKLTSDEYAPYGDSGIFSDCEAQYKNNANKDYDGYSFYFEEQDSVYAMYGATSGLEEIAYCRLSFQPSFTVISHVYVDEKLRGKGLGSIFMNHFIMDYFSKYKKPLVLNVRSINIPAIRIYQKCRFQIIETVKYYVI